MYTAKHFAVGTLIERMNLLRISGNPVRIVELLRLRLQFEHVEGEAGFGRQGNRQFAEHLEVGS
jgi:hypothetical protein